MNDNPPDDRSQDTVAMSATEAAIDSLLKRQVEGITAGAPVAITTLLDAAPVGTIRNDLVLELVLNEIMLRQQAGETPRLEDYQRLFPEAAAELQIQWDVDRFLYDSDDRFDEIPSVDGSLKIGRYEVDQILGSGGIGIVYQAFDPLLKRTVAIKLLKAGRFADSSELARFRTEAEAVARIRDEHVVQVYDVGEADGEVFIAMEYCAEGSLAARLRDALIPPQEAAYLVCQIARGVAAAHEKQIIHRDLKPSNIFMQSRENSRGIASSPSADPIHHAEETRDSGDVTVRHREGSLYVPKVSDFGLARFLDRDDDNTRPGMIIGTPAYMAPEQSMLTGNQVGPSVDIYALGVILYECLTGKPPFRGATAAETLDQVRNQEPVPVRRLQPGVSVDLETIAMHCLQKEPSRRYASARDVAEDLENYLDGKAIRARRISIVSRGWRWCRRNRRVAWLLLAISILLLSLIGGSTVASVLLKQQRDTAREALETAQDAKAKRLQELFRALIMECRSSRQSNAVGHRENGLAAIRTILTSIPRDQFEDSQIAELRDEAMACLARSDVSTQSADRYDIDVRYLYSADVDARLERIVCGTQDDRDTLVGRFDEVIPKQTQPSSNRSMNPGSVLRKMSPDGRWAIEHSYDHRTGSHLRVYDCEARCLVLERTFSFGVHNEGFAFHPTNPWLYMAGSDRRILILDLTNGAIIRESPERFRDAHFALNGDGTFAVVACDGNVPEIINTDNWQSQQEIPEVHNAISVAWRPNSQMIAIETSDGRIYYWHIDLQQGHWLPGVPDRPVVRLRFSPDGEYLASSFETPGTTLRTVAENRIRFSTKSHFLGFSSDSRRLVLAQDKAVAICEITADQPYSIANVPVDRCAFSPDGKWLSVGSNEGAKLFSVRDLGGPFLLGLDPCGPGCFHPQTGDLLTFGIFSQLWRWRMTSCIDDPVEWNLGPAVSVPLAASGNVSGLATNAPQHQGRHAVWTPDGKTIVVGDYRHNQVVLCDDTGKLPPRLLGALTNVNQLTVSPDGVWVGAAARIFAKAIVWNRETGEAVWAADGCSQVGFSFDACWFAAALPGKVQIFRVSDWRLERELPCDDATGFSAMAFQPHGHLLAYRCESGKLRLIDCRDWSIVGHLIDPENIEYDCIQFSPDGTRLAFTSFAWNLGIWNLSEMAQGLKKLELPVIELVQNMTSEVTPLRLKINRGTTLSEPEQWTRIWLAMAKLEEIQGIPADAAADVTKAIEQIRFGAPQAELAELYTRRGYYHYLSNSPLSARNDWKVAIQLSPQMPEASRRLARLCLMGPPELRDPLYALSLLGPFAFTDPPDSEIQTLVGVAQFRMGQLEMALKTLEGISDKKKNPLRTLFLAATREAVKTTDQETSHQDLDFDTSNLADGQQDRLEQKELEMTINELNIDFKRHAGNH